MAPDGSDVGPVTIKARIKAGCGAELLDRLRKNPKDFEVTEDDDEQDFSIAYLVDSTTKFIDDQPALDYVEMRNLPPRESARALGLTYQKVVIVGGTNIDRGDSEMDVASKAMHLVDKKRVHGGSVSRDGDVLEM